MLSFVYFCIAVGNPVSKGASEAKTWISNFICCGLFSVQWVMVIVRVVVEFKKKNQYRIIVANLPVLLIDVMCHFLHNIHI